jgi:hypothetical protein
VPVDFTVKGAEEIQVIARSLKAAGDTGLRKELLAGINRATKPLKAGVRQSALTVLPKRGGLNLLIGAAKLSTQTRSSGRNPGVRITAKAPGLDLRSIDRGRLRHPVFGDKRVWVSQAVAPGFFGRPLEAGAGDVRRELMDALEAVAAKIVAGRS